MVEINNGFSLFKCQKCSTVWDKQSIEEMIKEGLIKDKDKYCSCYNMYIYCSRCKKEQGFKNNQEEFEKWKNGNSKIQYFGESMILIRYGKCLQHVF
jgi:hypothetical protein